MRRADALKPALATCGAEGRTGAPCKKPAGMGTDHLGFGYCKFHTGSTPGGVKAAEKERAAWQQFLLDEMNPSLKVVRQLRDGEDVAARDRIKAASWLVEQARTLVEGTGGEIVLRIKWPE